MLGVPQRNILGPLLFNIYVNSLPNAVENARVILYADDAVLISAGSTSQELQETLEHNFSLVSDWYSDNRFNTKCQEDKLILAGSKTKFLKFEDFKLQSQDGIDRVKSFKISRGEIGREMGLEAPFQGHRLSIFNRITHMLHGL